MSDERRRYFRIDESMGVAYRVLGAEEAKIFAEQTRERGHLVDFAANFDNRIQTLLDTCKIESPIAAELADLINKKLNFVIHQLDIDAELMQKVAYTLRQVNVSACGLACHIDEPLQAGAVLQMDLVLSPGDLHIVTMAKVIACEAAQDQNKDQNEGPVYFLRVEFEEIHHNDQELLIQHIVKQQSLQLKKKRLLDQTSSE